MQKIIGRKPVLEAINSGAEIEVVYVAFGQHGDAINRIFTAAKKNGIKVSQVSPQKFNSIAKNEDAQGVVAFKSTQKFYELGDLIDEAKKSAHPLLLLLDSIQDPHNLGAILRTAECAGVDGVIVTTNQSSPITETVEKISAGAVSYVKVCRVNNLVQTMNILKEEGFWTVGTSLNNSKNYAEMDYKMPVALVMGNEEKGIRKLVAETCDFLVKIPMNGKVDSLNVSVATGVLLFEINRQRNS
ncbi:MAG: 23S rRNA (guanosine(2251)-2'-O)-methyltransferase RlmB [Stygiobacter sp. RIFOXYC12_FULL_38_8]|nr:MAG: 23S rRNA (guanosine(2251)-2'-O)-methyltransferase RlmB [Stygiobacter sp. GWC2_38_9]OGU79449.1 MAG: 23S rRNA (guanosine(2251)-2'-O)-methyltransferase RlmB [Stygiobacter sp. RIFOXYA12_FULL_38_9]OGV07506.1 MAG: 23S rRNA (guanosine(2251)-2'-O)-methyltransferase RlmB [Stygiobacter sp. RIFOXYB2_FULL_37_11]OGV11918.1 MAG: 23S rRNA (guanosine(2251)-2'-O)-methyltransferase RlmB [Stygiobacter sp. RIFOXYA2_FULL_38_8]OGV13767.1 MAG: 23S rRNA (guanosine(2251)-2'-O)-methyltransferase RlmB [Stygiobact